MKKTKLELGCIHPRIALLLKLRPELHLLYDSSLVIHAI